MSVASTLQCMWQMAIAHSTFNRLTWIGNKCELYNIVHTSSIDDLFTLSKYLQIVWKINKCQLVFRLPHHKWNAFDMMYAVWFWTNIGIAANIESTSIKFNLGYFTCMNWKRLRHARKIALLKLHSCQKFHIDCYQQIATNTSNSNTGKLRKWLNARY